MATTENTFTGNGSTTNYSFTFPYIKTTDVKASINGTDTTAFTLANATTVQFNTAPANSAAIRIYRATDDSALPATFYAGSSIKSSDLNDNFLQNLYTNQETNNNVWTTGTKTIDSSETWAGNNTKIATTGAIDGRVDAKIDTALGSDVLAGTDLIKTVSGGQVTVAHNVNGANSTVNNSNGNVIQDITISAQGHVTSVGSIDLDGRYYTETELNAGQLDNRYYTETETGSLIDSKIDTAITTDILAGQSITKTNGSGQVTISIANGAIGTNQIADDAVTLAKLGSGALPTDITVASDNIVNGTIVAADIATGALDGRYYTETELDAGELDSRYYTETELNAGQLDNRYYTETELNAGQLDNRYYTETEADARFYNLTSGEEIQSGETWAAADNKIATTAAIDARITDLVDDVGGFVPIANETSFPNANPDINNGAGTLVSIKALSSNLTSNGSGVATIANGTVGNSTVTINGLDNSTTYNAGFGMIVETTTTLNTYTFHRQVPKATEVTTVAGSITNVNNVGNNISNVNTVAGVSSNVTTVAGVSSNVTTVAGIASNVTTVAGISSDITAVAADATDIGAVAAKATEIGRLGTADAVSDMNTLGTTAIVSDLDTCATNISNINNVGGSIANVNTVAGNLSGVNSFGERYRVASSAPSSGNDEGDLYFDTTANELKVYNGSAWQGGVTASGNFASTTGNTFTGNNTYQDNVKAQFGTGDDLKIYHDGTKSVAVNYTGDFHLRTNNGGGSSEEGIIIKPNGATELYYDNSKKFATTSTGILIDGSNTTGSEVRGDFRFKSESSGTTKIVWDGSEDLIRFFDSSKATFGTGDDLQLYHDGTNSYVKDAGAGILILAGSQVQIANAGATENIAKFIPDGAVELYYDNSKKLSTTSSGGLLDYTWKFNDGSGSAGSNRLVFGTGDDLSIYHNGSTSKITNTTGQIKIQNDEAIVFTSADGSENTLSVAKDGAVTAYYDNVKKFETTSVGAQVTGDLYITNELNLGGDGDEHKFLDVQVGTNAFNIRKTTGGDTGHETMAKFVGDGAVELYYDNAKKFETSAAGVVITGVTASDPTTTIYHSNADVIGEAIRFGRTDLPAIRYHSIKAEHSGGASSNMLQFHIHDGSTTTSQTEVLELTGDGKVHVNDNIKFECGTGGDIQIFHNGSHSYLDNYTGTLHIRARGSGEGISLQPKSGEQGIEIHDNGAVELYYDDSKKLETTSGGGSLTGDWNVSNDFFWFDNGEAVFGSGGDLKIYHDGSNSYIDESGTGQLTIRSSKTSIQKYTGEICGTFTADGAVELYYDNSKKLETFSWGTQSYGHVACRDDDKLLIGNNSDLQIYHDGTHNYIQSTNGRTYLVGIGRVQIQTNNGSTTENSIVTYSDGAVHLYYDNSVKFETTSTGVAVTGNLNPVANNTHDLGTSSLRWNNLYVNDMHFSNHPENPNSVDGTWGDWTLQEGENDIFMLNNRTGKKYKMALTEVS